MNTSEEISKSSINAGLQSLNTSDIANSVDSGTKGKCISNVDELSFDENITFIHNYLSLRKFDEMKPKTEEFPVLINHEFFFGGKNRPITQPILQLKKRV